MDFSDEDFDKARALMSDTQLYKQAGNSIVRGVLVAILGDGAGILGNSIAEMKAT